MKIFKCGVCQNSLYFDNHQCTQCKHLVGFDFNSLKMISVKKKGLRLIEPSSQTAFKWCLNHRHSTCNSLIPADSQDELCLSCKTNQVIPDISINKHLSLWRKIEPTKRRIIYALKRLQLPLTSKQESPTGIGFQFIADSIDKEGNEKRVFTGHADGIITLNIEEADNVIREKNRINLGERYRTLEGHLRHEIGHYYWDRLIYDNEHHLKEFRALFGDERIDYGEALKKHYEAPNTKWQSHFISQYASSHPWEDWAESWAHYLHMLATVETAFAFGLSINPVEITHNKTLSTNVDFDPYKDVSFAKLIDTWMPITLAINSINRSMGQPDLYPFVLNDAATQKLEFVHSVIRNSHDQTPIDFGQDNILQRVLQLARAFISH